MKIKKFNNVMKTVIISAIIFTGIAGFKAVNANELNKEIESVNNVKVAEDDITTTIQNTGSSIGSQTTSTTSTTDIVQDAGKNIAKPTTETQRNSTATNTSNASLSDILQAGGQWVKEGEAAAGSDADPVEIASRFVVVGQILITIGIGTLVITSMIMAIRWLVATPEKKAKLQEQLIGLVVATVVIFGAYGIWNIVRTIMQNTEDKLEETASIVEYTENTNYKA